VPGSSLKPDLEITDAVANVVADDDAGVVVELRWRFASSDEEHRRYQTLRMRDGLVFDMQDYHEERSARRALR
jgi:hypothetical protein